jgi:PKHD-type hydroxylase
MTMLIEIPDVLTPDELRQCRDLLQQASWHDGRQTAGHIAARAKDNQQLAQDDPLAEQLSSFLLGRLGSVSRFVAAALP